MGWQRPLGPRGPSCAEAFVATLLVASAVVLLGIVVQILQVTK